MSAVKDMVGQKFGALTVIRMAERSYGGVQHWYCRCACGNVTEKRGDSLRSGQVVYCKRGCVHGRQRLPGGRQRLAKRYEIQYRCALKRRYGIRWDEYIYMLRSQDSECLICGNWFDERPHVDHNHETGLVRGLLCSDCNLGLGIFGDSSARILAAAEYLESREPR
jgi:hypothetical protein